jgi:hypothetical protein
MIILMIRIAGPDEAYFLMPLTLPLTLPWSRRIERRAECLADTLGPRQIGRVSGNSVSRRSQQARQAHQRRVQVKFRQWRSLGYNLCYPGTALKQLHELRPPSRPLPPTAAHNG